MVAIVIFYESRTSERNVRSIERTLKANIRGFPNHTIYDRDNLYCTRSFSDTFALPRTELHDSLLHYIASTWLTDLIVKDELVFLAYDIVLGVRRCVQW